MLDYVSYLSALPGVDAARVEESHDPGVLGRDAEDLSLGVALVQGGATAVPLIRGVGGQFRQHHISLH